VTSTTLTTAFTLGGIEPSGTPDPNGSPAPGADGTPVDTATVAGHGITLEVPADWIESGHEKPDLQGRTYEWGVQAPTPEDGFPPFVSMSMGVPGQSSTGFDAAPEALKTLERIGPDYRLIDEGSLEVPGAEKAYQVHFVHGGTYHGQQILVEQIQVFLQMPDDVLSTVRFQAPEGHLDGSAVRAALDSLRVAVTSPGS